jgi:hypothetical protein
MPEPPNINNPVIRVAHAELERWGDGPYKSKCPSCKDGLLLIHRDEKTFSLQRQDRCISCGQQFYYTDSEINGERFKVPFLMFELIGPPCEVPGCKGVLVDTIHIKTQMFSKKCATCGHEHYKMPVREAMGWAVRTIKRALNGEQDN